MKRILLLALFYTGTSTCFAQTCYSSQRFSYSSPACDSKMVRACAIADSILALDAFWQKVRNASDQDITNSNYTMSRLADTLQKYKAITVLELFPNTDEGITTAVTAEANHTKIYKAGYDQTVSNLAITIIHEWVHSVDFGINRRLQFAHRRPQYRWWNKNTASYRIEAVACEFVP